MVYNKNGRTLTFCRQIILINKHQETNPEAIKLSVRDRP
jgi:hypothetical protein